MKAVQLQNQHSYNQNFKEPKVTNPLYANTANSPETTILHQTSTKTEARSDECETKNNMHKASVNRPSRSQKHNSIGNKTDSKEEQSNNKSDIKPTAMNRFSNKVAVSPDITNISDTCNAYTNSGFRTDIENEAGGEDHEAPDTDSEHQPGSASPGNRHVKSTYL